MCGELYRYVCGNYTQMWEEIIHINGSIYTHMSGGNTNQGSMIK